MSLLADLKRGLQAIKEDERFEHFVPYIEAFERHPALFLLIFGEGTVRILAAMAPQGFAAYMQSYALLEDTDIPKWLIISLAAALGIAAAAGKFFLILFYNLANLLAIQNTLTDNLLSRDWWRNLPSNIRNMDTSDEAVGGYIVNTFYYGFSIVPALLFGFLTKMILKDYRELVNKTDPGIILELLADASKYEEVQYLFIIASMLSNLISAPKIMGIAPQIIRGLIAEFKNLNSISGAIRYLSSLIAGLTTFGVVATGFVNFEGIGHDIALNYLHFPKFHSSNDIVSELPAHAFGAASFYFMLNLAFISGLPLGKAAAEKAIDIVTCRYRRASIVTLLRDAFLIGGITAVIVILGGLPNVWQAVIEDESILLEVFSEIASAVTEAGGTYAILKGAMVTFPLLLWTLFTVFRRNDEEFAYRVIGDDTNVTAINDGPDENIRQNRGLIARCLPCFTFGRSGGQNDATQAPLVPNGRAATYGTTKVNEIDVLRIDLDNSTKAFLHRETLEQGFWVKGKASGEQSKYEKIHHTFNLIEDDPLGLSTDLKRNGFNVKLKATTNPDKVEMRINLSRSTLRI